MFRVSVDVPAPTKAMLLELNDQLAPLPSSVPASVTLPGASTASAPPEFNVAPVSTLTVAAGVAVAVALGTLIVVLLGRQALLRHTTGRVRSDTLSNAP